VAVDENKLAEVREAAALVAAGHPAKPFSSGWGSEYWVKWATIGAILGDLRLARGSTCLDIGCGTGWTTCFLAESGFEAVGVDLAPAYLEVGRQRAERWQVPARFVEGDMESFQLHDTFDVVLFFDALHHTRRQTQAIANAARHLKPGGWMIFGEPTPMHRISPAARRVSRERGWVERGVSVRSLKRDCRVAGLEHFVRYHEGTRPYRRSPRAALWQFTRLVAMHVWAAPQAANWLVARKVDRS
jgi:2-polyprenyl-3-methyl-5-hydroxy-6-metoxy-1,4-benzoquinol methylase